MEEVKLPSGLTEELKLLNGPLQGVELPSGPMEEVNLPTEASKSEFKAPITSIGDFLTPALIKSHLESLTHEEIVSKYADYVPISLTLSKADLIDLVQSSFFQQNLAKLTEQLNSDGSGYLLAQSIKYDYLGEGIENFLQGIRNKSKQDK